MSFASAAVLHSTGTWPQRLSGAETKEIYQLVTDEWTTRLDRSKLLGAAIALSRHSPKFPNEPRIGIALPATKGAVVANLAVTLADAPPVGLLTSPVDAAVEAAAAVLIST